MCCLFVSVVYFFFPYLDVIVYLFSMLPVSDVIVYFPACSLLFVAAKKTKKTHLFVLLWGMCVCVGQNPAISPLVAQW